MEEHERPDLDRVRDAMAEHDRRQAEPPDEDEPEQRPEREDEGGEDERDRG